MGAASGFGTSWMLPFLMVKIFTGRSASLPLRKEVLPATPGKSWTWRRAFCMLSRLVGWAVAMTNANLFPSMVLQMCAIGEESGSIDHMLGKAADFYEAEVDDMVAGLSSLMEPIIIVVLGTVIGGIVVSMYLPIFKLGQVV